MNPLYAGPSLFQPCVGAVRLVPAPFYNLDKSEASFSYHFVSVFKETKMNICLCSFFLL